MRPSKPLFALAVLAVFSGAAVAPPAGSRIVSKVKFDHVTKISEPTVVTGAPGFPHLLFAATRFGKIRVIKKGELLPEALLDIEDQVQTRWVEQGLLGLAFPPDFKKTGRYYVQYTAKNGDNKVDEYQVNPEKPTTSLLGTRRSVLRIPAVSSRGNHNGGPLKFLGDQLFISVGDGNDPGDTKNLAQNLDSLRGKILRILPKGDETTGRTYRIPASNPFVNRAGRDEVFAYGFRNPHSFDFYEPPGGATQMVISDVGQSRQEEINYRPFKLAWGGNFGWHDFEGNLPFNCGPDACPGALTTGPIVPKPGLIWPVLTYGRESGCAVIGGPVVDDPGLSTIRGRLIYGDFCRNRIHTALPDPVWITDDRPLGSFMPPGRGEQPALNGFGEDQAGHIYPFSNYGDIYRLDQTRVRIAPTRAAVKKWCASKKHRKKKICVKLRQKGKKKAGKAQIKESCARKKKAAKKKCRKSAKKPDKKKPKNPSSNNKNRG